MCAKVRAATVRSYVRAWRPLWRWWTGPGKQGLPSSGEAVLTYLEQRAAGPCAPSVLTRIRSALAFYEEVAGLPPAQRVSKCQSMVLSPSRCLAKHAQYHSERTDLAGALCSQTSTEVLRVLEVHGMLGSAQIFRPPWSVSK